MYGVGIHKASMRGYDVVAYDVTVDGSTVVVKDGKGR